MTWRARWERQWFTPVAAVRPRLLLRGVLLLLALDAWLLRVPAGGQYGADGFNVAHWAWLDAVQPSPTAGLYVGLMLIVGLFAMVSAIAPARPLLGLLALSWSWGWAMSLLDAFQHHYFLSLVLLAFVFFPLGRAADPESHAADAGGRRTVAWAFVVLGVNIALVYAFAAASKLDAAWRSGLTLQQIQGVRATLLPLTAALGEAGVSEQAVWGTLGQGVSVLEIVIAAGYTIASRLDDAPGPWARRLRWAAFGAAALLHGGAELLGLRVGWFSYYMIFFAAIYMLPERALLRFERILGWPVRRWARSGWAAAIQERRRGVTLVTAVVSSGIAGMAGFSLDLPGARAAGLVAVVALGAAAAAATVRDEPWVRRAVGACGLSVALMWAAVAGSSAREKYYADVARDLRLRGSIEAAKRAEEKSQRYPSLPARLADVQ